MEQSTSTSMDLKGDKKNRGCIAVHNVMKKDHAKPPENAHGLCLANPCRVGLVGGCGAGKTGTLLNIVARCAEWKPFDHIYLMGPSHCVEAYDRYHTHALVYQLRHSLWSRAVAAACSTASSLELDICCCCGGCVCQVLDKVKALARYVKKKARLV